MATQQEIRQRRSQQDVSRSQVQQREINRIQELQRIEQEEIRRQIEQAQNQESQQEKITRLANEVLRTGRGTSDDFKALSREEKALVLNLVNEVQDSAERQAVRSEQLRLIREVEVQEGKTLAPQIRQQIERAVAESIRKGERSIELPASLRNTQQQSNFFKAENNFNPVIELAKQAQDRRLRETRLDRLPQIREVSNRNLDPLTQARSEINQVIDRITFKRDSGQKLTTQEKAILTAAEFGNIGVDTLEVGRQGFQNIASFSQRPVETIMTEVIDPLSNIPVSRIASEGLPEVGFFLRTEPERGTAQIASLLFGGEVLIRSPRFIGRVAEDFADISARSSQLVGDNILFPTIRGKKGQTAIAITSDIEFDPITGLTRKRKKKLSSELDLIGALEESRFATTAQREADLREATRDLIKKIQTDPEKLNRLRNLYREVGRNDLFDDIYNQEIESLINKQVKKPISRSSSNLQSSSINPLTASRSVGGEGQVSSPFFGTGEFERTNFVSPILPREDQSLDFNLLSGQSNVLANVTALRNEQGLSPRISLFFRTSQPSVLSTSPSQTGIQGQPTNLRPRSLFFQGLPSALGFSQRTGLRTRTGIINPPTPRGPNRRLRPPRRIKIPSLEEEEMFKKKAEKDIKLFRKAYDVFIGQGKKRVKIADDLPKGKALKLGADYVSDNIEATFELVEDKGKKAKGKDINYKVDFKKFRSSNNPRLKTDLIYVEKKQFRLDSGKEILQLKKARRNKR